MIDIYEQLESLGQDLPQFLILGGDTNTPFSQLDKQGGNANLKTEAIVAFDQLKGNSGEALFSRIYLAIDKY